MNKIRPIRTYVSRFLCVFCLAFLPLSLSAAIPLDINIATASEFSAVMSGVGLKKAEAIIAYRELNGRFDSIGELSNVKGIGSKLIARNESVIQVVDEEGVGE